MGDELTYLLGGLTRSFEDLRARNEAQAARDAKQQQSVFEYLLGSDDPELKALGLAGLLEPPKKTVFGKLKGSPMYEEALRAIQGVVEPRRGTLTEPSPPAPAAPGAAAMPDVPPLTGGGGETGLPAGALAGIDWPAGTPATGGPAPPVSGMDWPEGVPAVGGGPPAALPQAAPTAGPAAPSMGPPPTPPPEMAAAAVPSGPGDEEVVGDFLQQFGSPQEALDYIKENFDPFQADPRWAKVRGLLGAAQAAGGTMEDVRGQLFPKQLQAETGLTRAEISAEVRREANRSRAGLRVWETLFKSGDAWKRERARAADAMARLDKQITARLATGGGTWEEKLGKTAWSKYEYKLREKVSQTNQDFIALETGITSLREALARYTAPTAGEYEKQKAYSDFTQTVESMLGTIAKANDEGKRISDKDADRFRGALKPFLLDVGPDAWARLDPAFALERLDFTEKRFTEVRDAKVKEFHDDWKRGPGGPPPPPPPEPEEPGGPKKVKTQAEVDALPAGALFIWTDGKTYTKD